MTSSATLVGRELRRAETSRRINVRAQELALAHGLDGFSMEDLAEAAGVSRRTLFNYFPGKDAAVLGDTPEFDADLVAAFVSGGPHGRLVDDMVVLVESFLGLEGLSRDDIARLRTLMATEPRLNHLVQQRFELRAAELLGHVERREGEAFDLPRARVTVHVLAALFDLSLTAYLEQPERDLGELYAEAVATVRSAFT